MKGKPKKGSTRHGGYWFTNAVRHSELPSSARLVALVLASKARTETGYTKVSVPTLAAWSGLGESTVRRQLRLLEAEGFVEVHPAPIWMQKEGHPNEYVTVVPPGYPLDRFSPPLPQREGTPSQNGSPPLPLATKPPPAAGPSTTGTTRGGPSGSASGLPPAATGPLARLPGGHALRCRCGVLIREATQNDPCWNCGADDPDSVTAVDPDEPHPWERLAVDDPTCAICLQPHDGSQT